MTGGGFDMPARTPWVVSAVSTLLLSSPLVFAADLPPLQVKEGFAGTFAGVSGGAMLVCGGANFPDKKPWEGGVKVWTDAVYVLDKPTGQWAVAGKLPRPLGYGVSVAHAGGVVCVGGSNAKGHHADAFMLKWNAGRLTTTELPPLPKAVANGCGALVGDVLYVAGGIEAPDAKTASADVCRIDLSTKAPKWETVPDFPGGGRMLASAAGFDGAFWLVGGVELVRGKDDKPDRTYLTDAYRYDAKAGWKRIADLPHAVAAAPSPMPTDSSGFFVVGCDDGKQWATAPEKHRGFNPTVLKYNTKADQWGTAGEVRAPRVTVPCVRWADAWVLPSGEVRPGVRSPDVTTFAK
jgi:N-acetylneuraminate epimerase